MNIERLQEVYKKNNTHVLPIKPGMRLEIHERVGEGDNQRIWKFKGLVLQVKKPNHPDGSFTIRGEVARTTIEKIYPLSFGNFEKVLLLDEHKVRRAKLFFMRGKIGKDAKLKSIMTPERKEIDLLQITKKYEPEVEKEEKKIEETKTEEVVEEVKQETTETTNEPKIEENVETTNEEAKKDIDTTTSKENTEEKKDA